jgi:SeqA protein N-terminal domain
MRSIEVSDDVWKEIAARGRFGEREDDVLRRVFNLPPSTPNIEAARPPWPPKRASARGPSIATRKQSAYVEHDQLHVSYYDGPSRTWALPDRSDKAEIRRIVDEAVAFAHANGATDPGQVNAVRKALTTGGYWLSK